MTDIDDFTLCTVGLDLNEINEVTQIIQQRLSCTKQSYVIKCLVS